MKSHSRVLSQRYANAFASLAGAAELGALIKSLQEAAGVIASSDAFLNPSVPKEKTKALLQDIFSPSDARVKNMLVLLAQNKKIALLPLIIKDLQAVADAQSGTLRAQIYYYTMPATQQKKQIEGSLKKMFKAQYVAADYIEDKTLAGGLKITAAGVVIDGSTKNNLEKLQQILEV